MKSILFVCLALLTFNVFSPIAFAGEREVLECSAWGYTPNPEDFHNIKLEKIEPYPFSITESTITTRAGRVYTVVDPSTVGFENLDIAAYVSSGGHEVLYRYKNGNKTEIGISQLVDDSDAMYDDKELFTDCSSKPLTAAK